VHCSVWFCIMFVVFLDLH